MAIRTEDTKTVELMAYEKLSDMSVILGAIRTIYKRHSHGFDLTGCALIAAVAGFVLRSFI